MTTYEKLKRKLGVVIQGYRISLLEKQTSRNKTFWRYIHDAEKYKGVLFISWIKI